MIRLFNFNMPRAKQFNYRPMYYDERRERLEKMKARAAAELANDKNAVRHVGLEKGFLTENRTNSKFRRLELQEASIWRFVRLGVILVLLLSLTYYFAPEFFLVFWNLR